MNDLAALAFAVFFPPALFVVLAIAAGIGSRPGRPQP